METLLIKWWWAIVVVVIVAAGGWWLAPKLFQSGLVLYASPAGKSSVCRYFDPCSLVNAQARARTLAPGAKGDITVYLRGGDYFLTQPLTFSNADSGQNGHRVVYRAYGKEKPVLNGGQGVGGWTVVKGRLYKTTVGPRTNFRQLWVNGVRQPRAASPAIAPSTWHYAANGQTDGLVFNANLLPAADQFSHPQHLVVHFANEWRDYQFPVQQAITEGGKTGLILAAEQWQAALSQNQPPVLNPVYGMFVENDLALLDQPGEWYYDAESGELYYLAPEGMDMAKAKVTIPVQRELLIIKGSSAGQPVENLRFEGLTFAYTGVFPEPDTQGWVTWQEWALIYPKVDPPAVVLVENARQVVFERNLIQHAGIAGMWLRQAVDQITVSGNVFGDLGDSAVVVGDYRMGDPAVLQADPPVLPNNTDLTNNLVYNVGADVWSSAGMVVYYARNTRIEHNDLVNIPYDGFHIGWGWNAVQAIISENTSIRYNKTENVMTRTRDGGGVYLLGWYGPSVVEGNYFTLQFNDYAGLYPDEGSRNWTIRNNVVEKTPKWLHLWTSTIIDNQITHNYSDISAKTMGSALCSATVTTACDVVEEPLLYPNRDWPAEALAIIHDAGLEKAYRDLLVYRPAAERP